MSSQHLIRVSCVQSPEELRASRRIRQLVFVDEQGVDPEIEYDEFEAEATHVLAVADGQALGTARWRETVHGFKLERFAVLSRGRRQGVGAALVAFILSQIDRSRPIYLNSQVSAIAFYEKQGFKAEGAVFYEANIPHRRMVWVSRKTDSPPVSPEE